MRTMSSLVAAALLTALGAAPAAAFLSSGDKGTSGAQFLKISPAARPAAMGEAFAPVADDVTAAYYNPAGLGGLKKSQVAGSHSALFQQINYEYAAISVPLLSWTDDKRPKNAYGVLGVSISNLSVTGIERRGTTETDDASDTFGSSDFAYGLHYGYSVPDTGLLVGGSMKYIDQKLDATRGTAFGLDLGSLYRVGRTGYAFGLRNVGKSVKFGSESDPLPTVIYTGAAYRFTESWLGSLEVDLPRDNKASFAFGTEYRRQFMDKLSGAGRFGYNSRNTDAGGFSGVSFGLGLGYGSFDFDFALVPFGDLGSAYKYSLLVKF